MGVPPPTADDDGVNDTAAPANSTGSREQTPHGGNQAIEWEYEYDENETEDFYFTLDVTAHQTVPISADAVRGGRPSKRARRTVSPVVNDVENTTPVLKAAVATDIDAGADNDNENADDNEVDPNSKEKVKGVKTLQLLDLHTTNPLIKLDDTFYSCSWATPLGTQVYLAPSDAATVPNPLRPGYKVDMVALSRARLQARPLTLTARRANQLDGGSTAADPITLPDDQEDSADEKNEEDELKKHAGNREVMSQSSFLTRLAAIKRKRGETDEVPLTGMKDIPNPVGPAQNSNG